VSGVGGPNGAGEPVRAPEHSAESGITRREALVALGGLAVGAALGGVAPAVYERVIRRTREAVESPVAFTPQFFTPHEWRTVRVLADLVIPADGRSGSATDAGVPEFMDFMLMERESHQIPIRGGLRWLDSESVERFAAPFVELQPDQQGAILDDVAWPARARPEMTVGVAFFRRFRDLTASGFFSSKIGMEDLRYMGNRAVPAWDGCPPEALQRLGVSYDLMNPRPQTA
jgi:gluconate 2-dehydrogenase subunit 3-like protein